MANPILKFVIPQPVEAPRGAAWAAFAVDWIARHLGAGTGRGRP